jgi:predicted HD phosphohydrolase
MLLQQNPVYDELLSLLLDLHGVQQSPKYHPEADALYHSIQVFQCAKSQTDDAELLAAALLHDVGKAADCTCHAQWAAAELSTFCTDKVCWLIAHHLDLMKKPKKTQVQFQFNPWLVDLQRLRRWDLAGRKPNVWVMTTEEALSDLFQSPQFLLSQYQY